MADIVTWHGDGLSAGAFASGSGDTAHASTQGTAPTVVESGDRPPRIRFPGTSASYVVWTFSALSELATFQDSGLNPSQEYQYRVGAVMG